MAGENEEKTNAGSETPAATAKETPPTAGAPAATAKPAETLAATAKPAETPAAKEGASKEVIVGDDDEIPENAELLKLSGKTLKKRLERHTAKELKERFGTSDMGEIGARLKKLSEFEAKEEENRRQQLSNEERLKEDAERARAEAAEWREKYEEAERNQVIGAEESRVAGIAKKHVKDKFVRYALPDFATHLRQKYTPKELDSVDDAKIEEWFAQYAKENPEFAVETQKPAPKVEKKPVTNSVADASRPTAKTPPGEGAGGRSMRPGQQNSMSTQEARAEAAKAGFRW
jgi:hypothetical protein